MAPLSYWLLTPGQAPESLFSAPLETLCFVTYVLAGIGLVLLWRRLATAKRALRIAQEQARDRAEVERVLKKQVIEDRVFFSANPHPMWVFDVETLRFLEVNDAAIKQYGYRREEFMTMTIRDIRPPEEWPLLEEALFHAPERRSLRAWRHRTKSGAMLLMNVTAHDLSYHGRAARLVMAVDVTSQKENERALVREKERFELLSNSAAELLFAEEPASVIGEIFDKLGPHAGIDLYLHFASDERGEGFRLQSSAGLPEETLRQLQGTTFRVDQLLCGNWASQRQPMIKHDLQQCTEERAAWLRTLGVRAYVCYPLHPNGKLLGTLALGSRTKDQMCEDDLALFETLARYLSIALDRWHLLREARHRSADLQAAQEQLQQHAVELEARVAERTAHLEQSLKALEGILYHVAHDLRAPLRAMHGFTQLLIQQCAPHLTPDSRQYSCAILQACKRMDRLIHDLLLYGRLEHQSITRVTVDLGECLECVLERLAGEIQRSNAQIQVSRPLPQITGDKDVVGLILENLLTNAFKFVSPGVAPSVKIWAEAGPQSAQLHIQDQGIGIPAEYHDRIFGIFERLHADEDYPGTGIGLAIVKKGMERLGGEVTLHSVVGQGSHFCLEFKEGVMRYG